MLKIKNKRKLKELSYKDLHLFCQSIVPRKNKDEVISINVLLDQIEHFGTKSLFKNLKFRHRDNVFRIDTFDIYLMSVIENLDYEAFQEDYFKLLKAGLRHDQILDHVKSSKLFFFHRGEGFEKLLNFFLKSNNKELDDIILGLVRNIGEMRITYEKFRETNSNSKLRIIDKIFKRK